MKKNITALLCSFFLFALTSCDSSITVTSMGKDKAQVDFGSAFSKVFIDTFGTVSGSASDSLPLNSEGTKAILTNAGLKSVYARTSGRTLTASGIYDKASSALSESGIIKSTEKSLSLTVGPDQFKSLYSLLDEEGQSYFDLLMIPCLIDDEMSCEEYTELVASMYGNSFATDLTEGKLSVTLYSPDKTKKMPVQIKLGELFTMTESKTWSISW